ncbi:hypothetical protein [Spiroplasma cantharicola]|uniref:MATE efflux family protein n=1 Tax=Spiroplasma cantharicola TaxID=362837 RepID=A0A0M4KE88_9MOLU|nr:hypothetical protein [Spiroplasma cantharicola]ALD66245.1 hypothetical protein SCANT_v1c03350 [Spiroplasma cantharicola]
MNLVNFSKKNICFIFKEQKDHWKLFIWMFLYSLIPAIWILVRTLVITQYMEANIDTYAQWDYLNIMLEVIQETIVFPLFWWFGKIHIEKREHLNKLREVYLITFFIYFILIIILSLNIGELVNVIGSNQGYEQKIFFTLQLWSKIPEILTSVSTVVILNLKMYKGFLVLLISKLGLSIIFDFTLANNQVFNNSYVGLGVSTLITQTLLFLTSLMLISKAFGFKIFFNVKSFNWNLKKLTFTKIFWLNVLAAFIFSTVNNSFYLFMIAKNMNIVAESDAYWLSNTVIWSWILMIPNVIFAINKSIVSTSNNLDYKKRVVLILEFQLIALISLLLSFAIFIPTYNSFTLFLSNNNSDLSERSWNVFSKLIGFFIFYILATSFNAHFNGEGKNIILAVQAIICNLLTFVPFIILNSINQLIYDVEVIAFMFGFSLFVSWIISMIFIISYLLIEKNKYISNNIKITAY